VSLRRQAAVGVKATLASNVSVAALQFVQIAVLAHFLGPRDFGVANMAIVVAGFVAAFADLGLGSAIIQRQRVTAESLSSLLWVTIIAGAALAAILTVAAPLVADVFQEPHLSDLVPWVGVAFLVLPAGTIYRSLLEKDLAFGTLARIEVTAACFGFGVAVGTAAAGSNAIAIVWGFLAMTGCRTFLFVALGLKLGRPAFYFSRHSLEGYLWFGSRLSGQRTLNFLSSNLDFILVGRFLGSEALGFYALAYNLANVPASRINMVISNVFFPIFARFQSETQRLKRAYLKMQEFTSLVNFWIIAVLATVAPVAIPLVYGERWTPAVVLLQILAVVGLTRSVAGTVGPLLLARGRTDLGFRWSILVLTIQGPGLYIAARTGNVNAVAIAFLGLQLLVLVLNYVILVRTLLGPCLREYAASMWPAFWMTSVTAGAIVILALVLGGLPGGFVLALELLVALTVYTLLVAVWNRSAVTELRELLGKRAGP
jgi:lipopolysaccharide exporter